MPTSTTRGQMPAPALGEVADGPAAIQALANQIAALALLGTSGTLAARPTPVAGNVDQYYFATDNGLLYRWSGSTWVTVNPIDAAAGTGSMRTLGTGAAQAAPGNDSRILGATQITSGVFASRPAAGTANRLYRATDTKVVYIDTGTEWLVLGGITDTDSTVLAWNAAWPASPVTGQEVVRYSDSANQVVWRFRYDSSATAGFRWRYVGGAPLYLAGTPGATRTPNGAGRYVVLSTPTFTPGIAGKWKIRYEYQMGWNTTAFTVAFLLSTLAAAASPALAATMTGNGPFAVSYNDSSIGYSFQNSATTGIDAGLISAPPADLTAQVGLPLTTWLTPSVNATGTFTVNLYIEPIAAG